MAAIVAAKGDTDLAAEKLSCSPVDLIARVQLIDFMTLSEAIKSIVAFQMLDTLKYVQLEVISKLDQYSPSTASRLLVDLLDRLQTLSTPAPTQQNNSPVIIQQMMMNESQSVREELARRIINSQSSPPPAELNSDRGHLIYEQDGN